MEEGQEPGWTVDSSTPQCPLLGEGPRKVAPKCLKCSLVPYIQETDLEKSQNGRDLFTSTFSKLN